MTEVAAEVVVAVAEVQVEMGVAAAQVLVEMEEEVQVEFCAPCAAC